MSNKTSRSREGAWIEILKKQTGKNACMCRSREGAWIEIAAYGLNAQRYHASLPRGSVD